MIFFVCNMFMNICFSAWLVLVVSRSFQPLARDSIHLTMDTSAFRDMLRQLSSTDIDMDDHMEMALRKCCYLMEKMTADRSRKIVKMAKDRPCLQVYMSDGWSTDLRSKFHSESEGVRVQRTGRLRS